LIQVEEKFDHFKAIEEELCTKDGFIESLVKRVKELEERMIKGKLIIKNLE
jgi:hypothetical protein